MGKGENLKKLVVRAHLKDVQRRLQDILLLVRSRPRLNTAVETHLTEAAEELENAIRLLPEDQKSK